MAGLVLLTVGLIACGGGGSSGSGGTSGTQLQAKLISAADLGPGWTVGADINPQDLAAFSQVPCDSTTLSATTAKRLTAVTGAQFEPTDHSYRHVIELVVSGDAGQLDGDLNQLFRAIEACSGSGGSGANLTIKTMAIPTLGDQRHAFAVTQTQQAAARALSLRTAYVRVGSAALLLGLADFQASQQGSSTVSDQTFLQLLNTAVTRLRG